MYNHAQQSAEPLFRRVLEMWPYVFIAVSLGGFAYMALNSAR